MPTCDPYVNPDWSAIAVSLFSSLEESNIYLPNEVKDAINVIIAQASLYTDYFYTVDTTDPTTTELTSNDFVGKTVLWVLVGAQIYFRGDGFTQNDNETGDGKGDTVTFINGVELEDGQKVSVHVYNL